MALSARRDGQTIWYTISSGPARALLETLYRVYCAAPNSADLKLEADVAS
jgi:hypothetical protein